MGPKKQKLMFFFGQNTMPKKVPVHKNYEFTKTHILAKTLPKKDVIQNKCEFKENKGTHTQATHCAQKKYEFQKNVGKT